MTGGVSNGYGFQRRLERLRWWGTSREVPLSSPLSPPRHQLPNYMSNCSWPWIRRQRWDQDMPRPLFNPSEHQPELSTEELTSLGCAYFVENKLCCPLRVQLSFRVIYKTPGLNMLKLPPGGNSLKTGGCPRVHYEKSVRGLTGGKGDRQLPSWATRRRRGWRAGFFRWCSQGRGALSSSAEPFHIGTQPVFWFLLRSYACWAFHSGSGRRLRLTP